MVPLVGSPGLREDSVLLTGAQRSPKPLSSFRHQLQSDGSLVIGPLRAEDAGTYSCGSRRPGHDPQKIQLRIRGLCPHPIRPKAPTSHSVGGTGWESLAGLPSHERGLRCFSGLLLVAGGGPHFSTHPCWPHGPTSFPSPRSSHLDYLHLMTGDDMAVLSETELRYFPHTRDPSQGHRPPDSSLGADAGGRRTISSSQPRPATR
jgi:hypothetical protein